MRAAHEVDDMDEGDSKNSKRAGRLTCAFTNSIGQTVKNFSWIHKNIPFRLLYTINDFFASNNEGVLECGDKSSQTKAVTSHRTPKGPTQTHPLHFNPGTSFTLLCYTISFNMR